MKIITYAIDPDINSVVSRFTEHGSTKGLAVPVLDFAGMTPANNFQTFYDLENHELMKCPSGWLRRLIWTKKIATPWKNLHRAFWGMELLPMNRRQKAEFKALRHKVRLPQAA